MSFMWKCARCGRETLQHKEETPLYKVEPISAAKRKRGLVIALLILVLGILCGLAGVVRSTGQNLHFNCGFGIFLTFAGFMVAIACVLTKEEKKLIGVVEKYTCPVCLYTWESEKIKEGVMEPTITQPTSTVKGLQVKVTDYRTEEQRRWEDGMLLPQYWKCLVCKGGNKATRSVRANLFLMKFESKENFTEIDETSKKEIIGYVKYNFASVPLDQDASHLEDTLGIVDIGTAVIDAVFLCDDHYNEFMKGSWT